MDAGGRKHGSVRYVLLIDENVFLILREETEGAGPEETKPGGRSVFLIDENCNVWPAVRNAAASITLAGLVSWSLHDSRITAYTA